MGIFDDGFKDMCSSKRSKKKEGCNPEIVGLKKSPRSMKVGSYVSHEDRAM